MIKAVENQFLEVVQILLDRGAWPTSTDIAGASPILLAVYKGNKNIVAALLDRGASVYTLEPLSAKTVMKIATEKGYHDIVQLLKDRGAKE